MVNLPVACHMVVCLRVEDVCPTTARQWGKIAHIGKLEDVFQFIVWNPKFPRQVWSGWKRREVSPEWMIAWRLASANTADDDRAYRIVACEIRVVVH